MAYERTWAQSLDNSQTPATALEETQRELWSLKAMLLGQYGGLTQGLWTTYYSCNSVTAGTPNDGVDRWGSTFTAGNIVRGIAGAAHSWYVLKSPLMNGFNFYLLITFDGSVNANASLLMAKTPFTGGTTTANPTSVDSWALRSNASWNNGTTTAHRFNMLLSSTGDFWWLVINAGENSAGLAAAIVAPVGCDALDAYPIWSFMNFNPGSTINSPGAFKGTILTVSALATRDYAGTAAVIQTIYHRNIVRTDIGYDLLTGAQLDSPMWIIVSTSNGAWHHRGRLPDCVMGYENNNAQCAPNGDAVNPGTGIIAVQFGVMLLPFTVVPDLT